MPLRKIISGAQTGVDRAALDSAISRLIYSWGGWVPKGRLAEDGEVPQKYFPADRPNCGMQESDSSRYAQRTSLNVRDSDATLILRAGRTISRGTKLTITLLRREKKPYRIFDPYKIYTIPKAVQWICETIIEEEGEKRHIEVLNVAGPRESNFPGVYEQSRIFLTDVFGYVFAYQEWGAKIWGPKKMNNT